MIPPHYTYANHAYMEMLGCQEAGDIVGHPCRIFQPEEQVLNKMPEIMRTVQEEGVWRGELMGVRKDGEEFEQEASLTRLESGDFVCVARDISERKEVERSMQQSQRLESLGLLAGGIAHDFNNMLTAISSSAGLVQRKVADDSPVHRHIDVILKSTSRAADLTRQLLAYAGKGKAIVEEINLLQLMHDSLTLIGPLIPVNATLEAYLPDSLPTVTGDQAQIQQVLMNLLLNAGESLKDGQGRVAVDVTSVVLSNGLQENCVGGIVLSAGKYIAIQIKDSGEGMSSETLARVFDPFFTTKTHGRGLGLSATLGILKAHHGAIQVESIVGEGSTFRVYLPANAAERTLPGEQSPISIPATTTPIHTVLVADDEENIRHAVRDILNFAGFSVITAQDGADCLRLFKLRQDEISLVLVDVQMPVMTGAEVARTVQRLDENMPILFCSGYSEADTLNGFAGNVGYLQKPFNLDDLVAKVRQLLHVP